MKLGGEIVKKNSLGLTRMNELGWRYILVPLPNKSETQLFLKMRKNQTNKQGGKNETDKTKQRKKRTTKK